MPISCTNINSSDPGVGGAVGVASAGSDERFVHGKLCLLPFDKFVDPVTGVEDEDRTTFVSLRIFLQFPFFLSFLVCT